jgi:two-component system sensor histidine kinase BaeS
MTQHDEFNCPPVEGDETERESRRSYRRRFRTRWKDENFREHTFHFHRMRLRWLPFRIGFLVPLFFLLSAFGCIIAFVFSLSQSGFPKTIPHGFFFIPLLAFVVLVLVLGGILSRMVNPLDEVMDAADRVASGDYSARLKEHGPPQVKAFTRSFNTMTGRLQAYDEQRKRMLADISHELRTPLTVLQGNLEGMLDNVYPRDEEHIALLLEETQILSRLIDDLRTFSLAETGRLILQKESCDPARLVSDLVQAMNSSAAKAGVALIDRSEGGPFTAEIDPSRIREVLENLVSNAIRNTPSSGAVEVGCRRGGENANRVEFEVRDSGRGIPEDLLPHIFQRYVKSVDSGGTGLGLAIAKQLVEAHGGEIKAASAPGKGTVVRFWIPM